MLYVEAIPTLKTNYVWLLRPDAGSNGVYIVDPGEVQPVLKRLEEQSLRLAGILITHHHWDHTDGLDGLLKRFPVPVYGPDSVHQVTHPLAEGDRLTLNGLDFHVLAVPGHTLDHIAYFQPAVNDTGQAPLLFCGDALFAGGCGRLFEGTPEQALASLKKMAALPGDTQIYCAHEYTQANLRFARKADPNNAALVNRQEREKSNIARHGITLPTILNEELGTNPFLRCQDTELKAQVEAHAGQKLISEVAVFAALRRWKDVS